MCAMKVLLALLATHASTLVAGKRLVGGEDVYKGREVVRSFFLFITHCFLRFTKVYRWIRMEGPKVRENWTMSAVWRDVLKRKKKWLWVVFLDLDSKTFTVEA